LAGEDDQHAQVLAESGDDLPPILVHRATMRVIDGMHRLRAAALRGQRSIEVRYFDGSEDAAFVLAVQENITHGLPLSRRDREAAAVRLIASHPQRSDRWIAKSTGLTDKTIGAIRRRSPALPAQVARTGQDGRVRPLSTADGRRRAGALLESKPEASLREIAKVAGISLGTARDVRDRVRRGDDPVPIRHQGGRADRADRSAGGGQAGGPGRAGSRRDVRSTLDTLRRDPALRFSESGRNLLQWLDRRAVVPGELADIVGLVPAHCSDVVAELARTVALAWQLWAAEIERQASG
jgi:ParB-like chromosome segregation protein Spo0J